MIYPSIKFPFHYVVSIILVTITLVGELMAEDQTASVTMSWNVNFQEQGGQLTVYNEKRKVAFILLDHWQGETIERGFVLVDRERRLLLRASDTPYREAKCGSAFTYYLGQAGISISVVPSSPLSQWQLTIPNHGSVHTFVFARDGPGVYGKVVWQNGQSKTTVAELAEGDSVTSWRLTQVGDMLPLQNIVALAVLIQQREIRCEAADQ